MIHSNQTIDFIDASVTEAVNLGIFQLNAEFGRDC